MRPRRHVVDGGVAVQIRKLRDAVGGPVLRHPRPADRELVEAEHVHDTDRRQRRPEQLRPLIHDGADQQAAVRPATDRQLGR